jgi:hypothetical protein
MLLLYIQLVQIHISVWTLASLQFTVVFHNLSGQMLEGLSQLKNPVTSSGIKPAAFRLAAQCPNQLCYRMPQNAGFCSLDNEQYPGTPC